MMETTRLYPYASQNNKWFIYISSLKICQQSYKIITCSKVIQNTLHCLRFPRIQTACTVSCIKFSHTIGIALSLFCFWIRLFCSSCLVPGTLGQTCGGRKRAILNVCHETMLEHHVLVCLKHSSTCGQGRAGRFYFSPT